MSPKRLVPDLVPSLPSPPAPSRRGGARPGAGAPKGNLNALKHGRRSRLKNALPIPPLSPVAVARTVLLREQREVERVAATVLRFTLFARHRLEVAQAIADGRPIPDALLSVPTPADVARLARYGAHVEQRNTLERQRRDGRLTARSAPVRDDVALAAQIDLILPKVAELLDRAAHRLSDPAELARLLTLPSTDNRTNNQPPSDALESASPPPPTHPDSHRARRRSDAQSTPAAPPSTPACPPAPPSP